MITAWFHAFLLTLEEHKFESPQNEQKFFDLEVNLANDVSGWVRLPFPSNNGPKWLDLMWRRYCLPALGLPNWLAAGRLKISRTDCSAHWGNAGKHLGRWQKLLGWRFIKMLVFWRRKGAAFGHFIALPSFGFFLPACGQIIQWALERRENLAFDQSMYNLIWGQNRQIWWVE